jgi:small subunit ribosomal protein S5e
MNEINLFGKWSFESVEVSDISLQDYIAGKATHATFLPHTGGRYQVKRFKKAQCPIAERLVVSLMFHGRNGGKKLMAVRIVQHGACARQRARSLTPAPWRAQPLRLST